MLNAAMNPNNARMRYGLGTSIAVKSIAAENTAPASARVLSQGLKVGTSEADELSAE